MEICASNAPAKSIGYRALANVYFAERDFTDAIAWYGKALEVEAHHAIAFEGIGYSFQALGDYTNAMKNLEAEDLLGTHNKSEVRQRYEELRKAYAERGIRGYWEQRLRDTGTNNLYLQAVAQVHLDNTNVAVNLLEESFHERQNIFGVSDRDVTCLLFDPDWDGLHDHPRFKALLRKIGFTKVMPKKK